MSRLSWLSREGTIRYMLGESATHYYRRLDRLIDTQATQEAYPALCSRLRRLREARKAARSA